MESGLLNSEKKIFPKWVSGEDRWLTAEHCNRCGLRIGMPGTCDGCKQYIRDWKYLNRCKVVGYSAKKRITDKALGRKFIRKKPKVMRGGIGWNDPNPNYSQKARDKNRIKRHNYRARLTGAGGKLSKGLAASLLIQQSGRCMHCSNKLDDGYHLDHIIPISRGGRNDDANAQLLCPQCNLKKGAQTQEEFSQNKIIQPFLGFNEFSTNIEDWSAYCRSVVRNKTEWGVK